MRCSTRSSQRTGGSRPDRMDIVRRLEASRDETLRYFSLGASDLDRAYGPGKWTVRFLLHHIADTESAEFYRIRRILSEPKQLLPAFQESAWAEALDYANLPLALSRAVFEAVRNAVIHYAALHYEANGHLGFVHSALGELTLRDEFEKVANHNEKHLGHIRLALTRN
jgi:hypothetical protein